MFLTGKQGQVCFPSWTTSGSVLLLQQLVERGVGAHCGCPWDVHHGAFHTTTHPGGGFPSWILLTRAPGWSQEAARARAVGGKLWLPWSECSSYYPWKDGSLAEGLSQMASLLAKPTLLCQPGFGGMADGSGALGNAPVGFLQVWGQVAQDWVKQK